MPPTYDVEWDKYRRSLGGDALNQAIEEDLLRVIRRLGPGATVTATINEVEWLWYPALVRDTYWRLIAENRIVRSADGHLRVL